MEPWAVHAYSRIILNALQLTGRRGAGGSVPLGGCGGASRAGPARHVARLLPGAPMQPYPTLPYPCQAPHGIAGLGARTNRLTRAICAAVGATRQRCSVSAPPEHACGRGSCVSDGALRSKSVMRLHKHPDRAAGEAGLPKRVPSGVHDRRDSQAGCAGRAGGRSARSAQHSQAADSLGSLSCQQGRARADTCVWVQQGFQGEFLWPGTTDETAWLAVPAALAVIRALGPGEQAAYSKKLLAAAVPLLQDAFGTSNALGAAPNPDVAAATHAGVSRSIRCVSWHIKGLWVGAPMSRDGCLGLRRGCASLR